MRTLLPRVAAVTSAVLAMPVMAAAQSTGLMDAQTELEKLSGSGRPFSGGTDLVGILGNLINIALSMIGIYLLYLIIMAGWNWMNAKGDPGAIGKAKGQIQTAVVGVIIIMLSYAIANFVINALRSVA